MRNAICSLVWKPTYIKVLNYPLEALNLRKTWRDTEHLKKIRHASYFCQIDTTVENSKDHNSRDSLGNLFNKKLWRILNFEHKNQLIFWNNFPCSILFNIFLQCLIWICIYCNTDLLNKLVSINMVFLFYGGFFTNFYLQKTLILHIDKNVKHNYSIIS